MKHGVMLMSASVPTIGHEYAIKFAYNMMGTLGTQDSPATLTIVVCEHLDPDTDESKEPTSSHWRAQVIHDFVRRIGKYPDVTVKIIRVETRLPEKCDAPVMSAEWHQFWNRWADLVSTLVKQDEGNGPDIYFASEKWGAILSQKMGAEFVPVDMSRSVVEVTGTEARKTLRRGDGHLLMQEVINTIATDVVMFGAESVGKTTESRRLYNHVYNKYTMTSKILPEWAREYLELTPDASLTRFRMDAILTAQIIREDEFTGLRGVSETPLIRIFDTDILSTYGYFRLLHSQGDSAQVQISDQDIQDIKKDVLSAIRNWRTRRHYFVLDPVDMPVEKNILRYAGSSRESDTSFWTGVLEEIRDSLDQQDRDLVTYTVVANSGGEVSQVTREFDKFFVPAKEWFEKVTSFKRVS